MSLSVANGLFLHASAVVVDGGAMLFLGHSTAGKSTISRLLGNIHPILADDSVFAFQDARGVWRVVDGGFRREIDIFAAWEEVIHRRPRGDDGVRLLGCFRIHKAEEVRVETLTAMEVARYLMDAVMEIDLQRKFGRPPKGILSRSYDAVCVRLMRRHWFVQVAEIARICPGWNLWFPKDSGLSDLHSTVAGLAKRDLQAGQG